MISKTSRSYCKFFAVVQVIDYIVPYGSTFPTSRFTFKHTLARHSSDNMNVLFLIPRNGRPKERGKKKIILQVV